MSDVVRDDRHRQLSEEEIAERYTYHAPSTLGIQRHAALTHMFDTLANEIEMIVPPGRERSIVHTKLEEAKMWASAGVARNPETV